MNGKEVVLVFIVNKAKVKALIKFIKDMPLVDTLSPKTTSRIEKKFLQKKSDEGFLVFEEEALDPFQAVKLEQNLLEYLSSFYEYKKIIGSASKEADIVEKTCEFILLDQKASERAAFLSICNEFPLLKERVEYYSHMLSTPDLVYEFVEKHAERVRWQIMRIYRNRNLIIHNGNSMPYLGLLIENLHSYVDDFLSYSIHTISKGHDINSMCQELFSKECEWVSEFSGKKNAIDVNMISKMLAL